MGKIFWKFDCSFIHDELYVLKMKKYFENVINSFESDFNYQMKWEYLKYEIRRFTISFSQNKTKSMREKKLNLEKKLKILERKFKDCKTVTSLKMSKTLARKMLMLFTMK